MTRFQTLVARDLRLALRQGADSILVVGFFVITVALFPFGIGPEAGTLTRVAPGILWVTALLASMLSLDRLFQADWEDGSLELLLLTPTPLEVVVAAKVTAHWLTTGLPLLVATPVLALLLGLEPEGYMTLLTGMALGTPALSLLGAIGAALVLGARRGGVLVALLVLPLAVPVLIFGAGAVDAAVQGLDATASLEILGAILLATLLLGPVAAAAALRQALE